MKVGIREIAQAVGVSVATVSNALNGRKGVGAQTVRRVIETAHALGYAIEKAQTSHSGYIRLVVFRKHGLVVMDTQFFMELIESIEQECHANGFELMISHLHMAEDNFHERVRAICSEYCVGILLLGTEVDESELHLFDTCVSPMVVIDNQFIHEPVDTVVMNNYDAGYQAVIRLAACGHKCIGHITSARQFNNIRFRRKGYEAAMRKLGLFSGVNDPTDWIYPVTPTLEGAYNDMLALLNERVAPLPTAFFAANDIMAVGCIRAMNEKGLRVPDDVSVIGMDDLSLCLAVNPPLSTYAVYRRQMGRMAVRRLMEIGSRTEDIPYRPVKQLVDVCYIERASVRRLSSPSEQENEHGA